jgi:hypothetical protein
MKIKLRRASPALAVASIVLFLALGGSAHGLNHGRERAHGENFARGSLRVERIGKLRLRFGKLVDTDTTAGDGVFNAAFGHAVCKRSERVISGGVRQVGGNPGTDAQHIWMVESNHVPSKRAWYIKMNSDLGGGARQDFVVVAYCLAR